MKDQRRITEREERQEAKERRKTATLSRAMKRACEIQESVAPGRIKCVDASCAVHALLMHSSILLKCVLFFPIYTGSSGLNFELT